MESSSESALHRLTLAAVVFAGGFLLACDKERTPKARCEMSPEPLGRPAGFRRAPRPAGADQLTKLAPTQVTTVTPLPRYRWIADRHIVETLDGSVGFHVFASTPREATEYRFQLTVLVDYRPVGVELTIWSADRREKLSRHDVTSGYFELTDRRAVAADVLLPAETVTAGSWREVQTVVELVPRDDSTSDGADVRRWIVYAGSRPPPPVECVSPSKATGEERDVELVRLDGDVRLTANLPETPRAALVPLLDAKPIGSPHFLKTPATGLSWQTTIDLEPHGESFWVPVWREPFSTGEDAPVLTNFRSSNVLLR